MAHRSCFRDELKEEFEVSHDLDELKRKVQEKQDEKKANGDAKPEPGKIDTSFKSLFTFYYIKIIGQMMRMTWS